MEGKTVRNRTGERSVVAQRGFRIGDIAQHLRLISGIILFSFAATHFLNHAAGLISLELMHEVQQWRWLVTRSWPGTIILVSALFTHVVLGLYKTATRATLRLSAWELVQLGLGVSIPFLLLPHIVNTRIAHVYFGVEDTYLYELAKLWPANALLQSLLLIIVWAHGCIGLHKWLTFKSWYRHAEPFLIVLAVAIPVLALCGFMISGRSISELTKNPEQFKNSETADALAKPGCAGCAGSVPAWRPSVFRHRLSGCDCSFCLAAFGIVQGTAHHNNLHGRPHGKNLCRADASRNEQAPSGPACGGVWRASALLNVPCAD